MSNPGVISLASDLKAGLKIEDNIGEAIHIHYKNIRLDLTVKEFEEISNCMNDVIDGLIPVENFTSKNINPENLVQISPYLHKLVKAKIDEVNLKNLLINTDGGKYKHINKVPKSENNIAINKDEQIVLFGDKNFVICGQEQCKNLYFSQGDIKIPVTRFHFDKTVKIKDIQQKNRKITCKIIFKKIYKILKFIYARIFY